MRRWAACPGTSPAPGTRPGRVCVKSSKISCNSSFLCILVGCKGSGGRATIPRTCHGAPWSFRGASAGKVQPLRPMVSHSLPPAVRRTSSPQSPLCVLRPGGQSLRRFPAPPLPPRPAGAACARGPMGTDCDISPVTLRRRISPGLPMRLSGRLHGPAPVPARLAGGNRQGGVASLTRITPLFSNQPSAALRALWAYSSKKG